MILFSSHILEEVERLAQNVLVIVSGRLAASGRLPRDPAAHDRPAPHLHAALVGRPAAGGGPRGPPVGLRRPARRRAGSPCGPRTTPASPGRSRRSPGPAASRSWSSARPTRTSRASSATWCSDDRPGAPAGPAPRRARRRRVRGSVIVTIAALTARSLLGRRRSLLLVLLALLPVAAAILVRLSGRDGSRQRGGGDRDHGPAPRHDAAADRRARLRHGGPGRGARGRDRRLPPGQAHRPLADRGRQADRGGRPVDRPRRAGLVRRRRHPPAGRHRAVRGGGGRRRDGDRRDRLRDRLLRAQPRHRAGARDRPRLRPRVGGRPGRPARGGRGPSASASTRWRSRRRSPIPG